MVYKLFFKANNIDKLIENSTKSKRVRFLHRGTKLDCWAGSGKTRALTPINTSINQKKAWPNQRLLPIRQQKKCRIEL